MQLTAPGARVCVTINYSMKRLKLLLKAPLSRGVAFSAGQLSIVALIRVLITPDLCRRAHKTRTAGCVFIEGIGFGQAHACCSSIYFG